MIVTKLMSFGVGPLVNKLILRDGTITDNQGGRGHDKRRAGITFKEGALMFICPIAVGSSMPGSILENCSSLY